MKWTQSQPVPSTIWNAAQLAYHNRLDADLAASANEQAYLLDLQAAAVEYAEEAMGTSLLNRTITATDKKRTNFLMRRLSSNYSGAGPNDPR